MNLGMEDEYTEHKKSTSELREGMESVASILNKHDHGTLYFGVRPSDGEVIGQDVSEKTLRDVSQAFTNRIEPRVYPTIDRLVTDDGRAYIRVAFSGDERPYACDGRYRIRSADEDLPMNQSALRRLIQDEHYRKHPWDREASERPISDVDENELSEFVTRGQERGRIAFKHESVEKTLSSLGLLTADGRLTNAADVLFCPSLDVQVKMGVFVDHRRTEVLDMQHERGTIFGLVDAAERYIVANIRRRFVMTGARTRDEVPEIPREAIRESLLNAYAHRIWHRPGYVQVDIYHDAVDVISPGWFIDGQSPAAHLDGQSTSSDTRNRLIADTLFRSGDIESSGLGLPLIRDLCAEAGVRFTYEEIPFGTKLTFHRNDPYLEQTLGTDGVPSGSKPFQDAVGNRELSESEKAALAFLGERESATAVEISEAIGMGRRGVTKLLGRLSEANLVEPIGSQRTRRYRLR